MEQQDRDMLIEVHTIVKDLAPLVKKHETDINKGKGVIGVLVLLFGWLFSSSK